MEKIKFVPLTYGSDTKTYVRADTIIQLTEDGDKTCVYTSNTDTPMQVKEHVDEILAKIEGTALVDNIFEEMVRERPTIRIPDGATNGDMIKTMFGSPIREGETEILHMFTFCNGKSIFPAYFYKGWWNAPYKRESEDK